jgi:hypothetical protein
MANNPPYTAFVDQLPEEDRLGADPRLRQDDLIATALRPPNAQSLDSP